MVCERAAGGAGPECTQGGRTQLQGPRLAADMDAKFRGTKEHRD